MRTIVLLIWMYFSIVPVTISQAQEGLTLPEPGQMVSLSVAYQPTLIKGVTIHQDNPFLFDFIVDPGDTKFNAGNGRDRSVQDESTKLIKYFFAALAIGEEDLWVNLSPYEKNRIIPKALGQTEMGRDLLAQDYMLKQITASLIYPEEGLGKKFWDRVYKKAQEQYGNIQIPVNTFNKVWIMADRAKVFERNNSAFVLESHLKVMLEEDYLAQNRGQRPIFSKNDLNFKNRALSPILREIILPELEREINEGKNFANLRQIFNSIILSSWYKKSLKNSLLNQIYANKQIIAGIDLKDTSAKAKIYERYLQAYKKGVFNFIKDENVNGKNIPRKYFSGGINEGMASPARLVISHDVTEADMAMSPGKGAGISVETFLDELGGQGAELINQKSQEKQKLSKYQRLMQEKERIEGLPQDQQADATADFWKIMNEKDLEYDLLGKVRAIIKMLIIDPKMVKPRKDGGVRQAIESIRMTKGTYEEYPDFLNSPQELGNIIKAQKLTLKNDQVKDLTNWWNRFDQMKAVEAEGRKRNLRYSQAIRNGKMKEKIDEYLKDPILGTNLTDAEIRELTEERRKRMRGVNYQRVLMAIELGVILGRIKTTADQAMRIDPLINGGIDLKTSQMKWDISKQGYGFDIKADPAMLKRFEREGLKGLVPRIIAVREIANFWSIFSLERE